LGRYYQYYDPGYVGGYYGTYSGYAGQPYPTISGPQAALGVEFNQNLTGGAYITRVIPGSAAEQAGILPGDVIVSINGGSVASYQEVIALVGQSRPGDLLQIGILRAGQSMTAEAVLGTR
jgi:S1-C subfamily serine protease